MRRGAGSLLVIRLRYVWILIRALLMNILALIGALLTVAVPIGLLVATLHYGFAAFQELWRYGYGANGPFVDREYFTMLMRAATGLLAFLPAIGASALVVGRITAERDKKTWEVFLTTPLDAEGVLRSKARVAAHGIWQSAWPLLVLWTIGLVCGVLMPLGVALATIDLLLVVWASVAIGLYLAIRPGATSTASSLASTVTLGFFMLHAPLLWGVLLSPRELAVFATRNVYLRWGVVLFGLVVMLGTGLAAWLLTRRTLERFDEWVGRPLQNGDKDSVTKRADLASR
jgi:hypothetical protein